MCANDGTEWLIKHPVQRGKNHTWLNKDTCTGMNEWTEMTVTPIQLDPEFDEEFQQGFLCTLLVAVPFSAALIIFLFEVIVAVVYRYPECIVIPKFINIIR
uniref:Uncharacterized protein n=1 Tax=Romanomermis culicivorax TaxID=13658 RepID=A0A915KHT9_ROMCU